MLRDITLGQYYQADSVIHRLDPRVKLGATILFIISLFAFHGVGGYVTAALFFGAGDQIVRRAIPVHDQRNEIYCFSAVDYSDLQSVSDARRASF